MTNPEPGFQFSPSHTLISTSYRWAVINPLKKKKLSIDPCPKIQGTPMKFPNFPSLIVKPTVFVNVSWCVFFLSCLARIWVLHGKLTILFRLSPNFSKWNSQFLHGEIRICPAFFHRNPYQKVWAPKDLSKPNSASRNVMVTSVCKSTPARRKATCLVSTSFTMTSPAGQIVFFFTTNGTCMGHSWDMYGTFMGHLYDI